MLKPAESCPPPNRKGRGMILCYPTPLLKRRGNPFLNSNRNVLSNMYWISVYWGVPWKENYVAWIAPEPWLSACSYIPMTCVKFKWARGSHPHHRITFVFVPKWSRVGIYGVGRKGIINIIYPRSFCGFLCNSNITTFHVNQVY